MHEQQDTTKPCAREAAAPSAFSALMDKILREPAPAGKAWPTVEQIFAAVALSDEGESHPGIGGTWCAACGSQIEMDADADRDGRAKPVLPATAVKCYDCDCVVHAKCAADGGSLSDGTLIPHCPHCVVLDHYRPPSGDGGVDGFDGATEQTDTATFLTPITTKVASVEAAMERHLSPIQFVAWKAWAPLDGSMREEIEDCFVLADLLSADETLAEIVERAKTRRGEIRSRIVALTNKALFAGVSAA